MKTSLHSSKLHFSLTSFCSLTQALWAPHSLKHLSPLSRPPKEFKVTSNLAFTFYIFTAHFILLTWASQCPRHPPHRWVVYSRSLYLCLAGSLMPPTYKFWLWTSAEFQRPQLPIYIQMRKVGFFTIFFAIGQSIRVFFIIHRTDNSIWWDIFERQI